MRMAKKNKTSTARETVYDRCAYVGCYNGKFINGRKLFHFPAETDRRLEMWIERSGNFRLRTWAATSLRKAGLCADHFDERSFTNGTRKALRRNVVPRHYTEDFKYRRANAANRENRRDDGLETLRAKDVGGSFEEETSSLPGQPEEPCGKKIFQGDGEEETTRLETEQSRSSSPLVEFIVEELDEALILQDSRLSVNGSEGGARESEKDGNSDEEGATEREISDSLMSFDESDGEEISSFPETSTELEEPREVEKPESADELDDGAKDFELEKETEFLERRGRCGDDDSCSNLAHERTLRRLRNENDNLRKKLKFLKRKFEISKEREMNFEKSSATLKSIDDFLDSHECDNPATRALIKLSLHKPDAPFSEEEKKLAIQLSRNSPETFFGILRKTGCNLPGKNTIKRWIAEQNYGDVVDDVPTNQVDEVDDFHAPEPALVDDNADNRPNHSNGRSQDSVTFHPMETEIHYVPETIDGVEHVLESSGVLEARPDGERDDKEFFAPVGHETFS